MAGESGKVDIPRISSWRQVVGLIVGYAFVEITAIALTSGDPYYSYPPLAILGVLAFYIIRAQHKIDELRLRSMSEAMGGYLRTKIGLLEELKKEYKKKMNDSSANDQQVYRTLMDGLDIRVKTMKSILKETQEKKVE